MEEGKRRLDEAIGAYRRAYGADDKSSVICRALGKALAIDGHLDAAVSRLQQAVRLDPRDEMAYEDLANLLKQKGDRAAYHVAYEPLEQLRRDAIPDINYSDTLKQ